MDEKFFNGVMHLSNKLVSLEQENTKLKERVAKLIKFCANHAFSLTINANDTFYYASADATEVDSMDVEKLLEVYELFGDWGVTAFQAHLRKEKPIGKLTDEYHKALEYLKDYVSFGCEASDDKPAFMKETDDK